MNTTFVKALSLEKSPSNVDLDINDFVKSASKVIMPVGPITKFAAHNPWADMEQQSFEEVARRLKIINI